MSSGQLQEEGKRSLFKLLWGGLFRPRKTFTYLKENRKKTWWVPASLILVLTVAPLIAGSVVAARQAFGSMQVKDGDPIYTDRPVVEGDLGPGGGMGGAPPPPVSATTMGPGIFQIMGAIPGTIIAWLIWGVALYSASVFLGRSSGFGQMFRLTVWAWMPYGVRGLVQTIYILMANEQIVNPGLAGFVIDKRTPSLMPVGPGQLALASVLGHVDVYLFWNLALFVAGLMAFTNLPRKKALLAVLIIWVILTLLSIIPVVLSGAFGQLGGM
jgi:hypothetical protein